MEFGDSLKGFTLFANGTDFGGTITKGKIPVPKRTLKDRKPGGTNLTVRTQHGWELDAIEMTLTGVTEAVFGLDVTTRLDGQQILLRSAHEDEWEGATNTTEIEAWGRCEESDVFGELSADEDTEGKLVFVPARYKLSYAGQERWFYDVRTGEVRKNGTDLTEAYRSALGRA